MNTKKIIIGGIILSVIIIGGCTMQETSQDKIGPQPPEENVWLEWRTDPGKPNPWETWKNVPLYSRAPTEKTLITGYYDKEYGIEILDYRQIEVQPETERAELIQENEGITILPTERGLVIQILCSREDSKKMQELGWKAI